MKTNEIRAVMTASLLLALGGCAAEVGSSGQEPPASSSARRSSALIVEVKHGSSTVGFVDAGEVIGIAETMTMGQLPVSVLMERQGATPLDLYLTLTGEDEVEAPARLLDDHYARMQRSPIDVDLSAMPEELARSVSWLESPCSVDTLGSFHALLQFWLNRSNVKVLGSANYTRNFNVSTSFQRRDFHFSTCGHSRSHAAGVFVGIPDANPILADYSGNVQAGQMFHYSQPKGSTALSFTGFGDGGSNAYLAGFATQMW